MSPSCCWQLSSAGDFPRGLSPLLPLLSGTVVALARCHSPGNCVSTGPVCVNVTGVCGHEHTGTGGQSWNLDPRHHPFPALLPGAPGLQERAECLQGRAGVADLEQGTGGAPPRIHPWDIPGRAVSPGPGHAGGPGSVLPGTEQPWAQPCRALGCRELFCRGALRWFWKQEQDNQCWMLRCHVWLSREPETNEFVNTSCRGLFAAF